MSQARLFNAVEQLRQAREDRRKSMMQHMAGLDGYGQLGFAIGTGLARLFSQDERAREEQVAQGKNDYLAAYMQSTPEERAFLFAENGLRNFPDYAIEVKDMVDKDEAAAAEAARTARLMEIKEQELRIKQAEAGQIDTSPLTKVQQDYYNKIVPDVAQELGTTDTTWNPMTWMDGLSTSDKEIIIENAEMLRRSNKATNMTPRQALKLAMQNHIGGGTVKQEADAESQAQAQNKLDLLNKAKD